MKRIILVLLLFVISAGFSTGDCAIRTIRTVESVYNNDLDEAENYLFGRTYSSCSLQNRLQRLEHHIFNRTFPKLSQIDRVNNIMENYTRVNNRFSRGYYSSPISNIKRTIVNNLVGYPTGYSPAIRESQYINSFGPSYMRGFYGDNGWRYQNSAYPVVTRSGVRMLP